MSMSDPIADFLTRIRNGLAAKKRWVDVPSSALKKRISLVLKEEKYINDFFFITSDGNKETIRIFLKYDYNGDPVIENIKESANQVYAFMLVQEKLLVFLMV